MTATQSPNLILSLFPGIGLLDRAFEEIGFCIVRGPDLLWGGDVRRFDPPPGSFGGIIGGPPCQDFSAARRAPPTGNGRAMLAEFVRIVEQVRPSFWLIENVPRVPDVRIDGYFCQRIDVELAEFYPVRRLRHFQYGADDLGRPISVPRFRRNYDADPAVVASSGSLDEARLRQGLPDNFRLPGFTRSAARRAIGNGVPLPMGRLIAGAIADAWADRLQKCAGPSRTRPGESRVEQAIRSAEKASKAYRKKIGRPDPSRTGPGRTCACNCGRRIDGPKRRYASDACRKREQRRRESAT